MWLKLRGCLLLSLSLLFSAGCMLRDVSPLLIGKWQKPWFFLSSQQCTSFLLVPARSQDSYLLILISLIGVMWLTESCDWLQDIMVCFSLEPARSLSLQSRVRKSLKDNEASVTCGGGLEPQANKIRVSIKKHFLLRIFSGALSKGYESEIWCYSQLIRKGVDGLRRQLSQ